MPDVFISYSRKDKEFVEHIHSSLIEQKRDVWVDWEDIPRGIDWLKEIYRGIEAADTFIFVTSPDSLASEICNLELTHALKNSKRIVPVLRQDIEEKVMAGEWFGK